MKQKILIANWKMQLSPKASEKLARQLAALKQPVIVCPDYSSLQAVSQAVKASSLSLGAQNVSAFLKGPYTGQVSVANLKELGAKYVLLGHSEARQYLGESDELIKRKILLVLAAGLVPVLCVGEKKGESAETVLRSQLSILRGIKLKAKQKLFIAYEPLWAIGTGKALAAEKANEIQAMIKLMVKEYLKVVPPVLYGGSVDEKNTKAFAVQPYIDGLLIGGASLDSRRFGALAKIIFA